MIAGRTEEIALMKGLLESPRSEFLAVYGRRRIGKTFLVEHAFNKTMFFECTGLQHDDMQGQLDNFKRQLAKIYKPAANKIITDWLTAFDLLEKIISKAKQKTKKVIFLDEIAWFNSPRSNFKALLGLFWNQFCNKRNDIVLVICGSAASWIIKNIINDRGGLHNRVTQQINLEPFTLAETKQFFNLRKTALVEKDIVQVYMCTGGVAFYLDCIKRGQSVVQIIDTLFFGKNALLKNEYKNLFASLFANNELHEQIVLQLAIKSRGLRRSELLKASKLKSGGAVSTALNELVACGFIEQIQSFKTNKANAHYRLIDFFSIFYHAFVQNSNVANKWATLSQNATYKIWCGFAFENICLAHVKLIKKALGIDGIASQHFAWSHFEKSKQVVQIDLLIDRADNCINICEVKFYADVFEITNSYHEKLLTKKALLKRYTKKRKNIFLTMITSSGMVQNKYALSVVDNHIDIKSLFL